ARGGSNRSDGQRDNMVDEMLKLIDVNTGRPWSRRDQQQWRQRSSRSEVDVSCDVQVLAGGDLCGAATRPQLALLRSGDGNLAHRGEGGDVASRHVGRRHWR